MYIIFNVKKIIFFTLIVLHKVPIYDILFNCCKASRPMLNRAQDAATKNGSKTTKSLVSIKL